MADEKNLLMDFIEKKYPIDKIWEESERTCSEETREDFLKLVGRIIKDGEKSKRLRIFLHITLGGVACLAIIFLSSIVTWKMKDVDYLQVSAPRGEEHHCLSSRQIRSRASARLLGGLSGNIPIRHKDCLSYRHGGLHCCFGS